MIDTQLPGALARLLRQHGHQAEHVLDIGLGRSKDTPVWEYARDCGAVIVTKDEDFAEWVRRGRPGPAVVWLRVGNSSTMALLGWIDPLLPKIVLRLEGGDRLVEAR